MRSQPIQPFHTLNRRVIRGLWKRIRKMKEKGIPKSERGRGYTWKTFRAQVLNGRGW